MDKKEIYEFCINELNKQLIDFKKQYNMLKEAISNETKSTMGDKYETAGAMANIEKDKFAERIANCESQIQTLHKLNESVSGTVIKAGDLILTDKGYVYLTIAMGIKKVANKNIIIISPVSPLGKSFLNQTIGNTATFNGINYTIKEIIK